MVFNAYKGIGLSLVTALALVLRLHHLDYESLFMDELRQVSYYGNSFAEIVADAATTQQPPLDYWIGHIFFHFSQTDFSARLPAALFGAGSVWLLIRLAAKDNPWPTALLLGSLLALSPYHIYFSQDARPYAISIFFLLAFLDILDGIYRRERVTVVRYSALFIATLFFLMSRTDAPIVIVFLAALFVVGRTLIRRLVDGPRQGYLVKPLGVAFAIVLAVVCYAPFLIEVLDNSTRYAPGGGQIDGQLLADGFRNFSPSVIWRAFAVQTDPLVWLFLPLTLGGMVVVAGARARHRGLARDLSGFLLPTAALLHVFLLQAQTSSPFRPPYAIYMLPLSLLLGAYFVTWFQGRLGQAAGRTWVRVAVVSLLSGTLISQAAALNEFKQKRIKSDWRGLAHYLESHYDSRHVLMFETFASFDTWSPDFYGFPRYYRGASPGLSLVNVPANLEAVVTSRARPVLILFHYRNYFLSDDVDYGIFPIGRPDPIPLSTHEFDKAIRIQAFTGFSVVTLDTDYGSLALNTLELLRGLLQGVTRDSSTTTMHAVAGILAAACGAADETEHFGAARKLARRAQVPMLDVIESYRGTLPPKDCSTRKFANENEVSEN